MKKNNLVRRYIVFLFGLFISSLGVAFVKKSKFGYITDFQYSLCTKFKIFTNIRCIHNLFQPIFNCFTDYYS